MLKTSLSRGPSILALAALVAGSLVGCVSEPQYGLAPGVQIDEIAAYQAVERPLVVDGVEQASDVPLIQQRTTLLRVFVSTDDLYDGGPVLAVFTVGDETFEVDLDSLPAVSDRSDLGSTVNLEVPADLVGPTLDWSVELLQEDAADDNPGARFPAEGVASTVVEGRANVLSVTVIPFSYEADGSGRVPDLSPDRLEEFRARIMTVFPVSDVRLELHEPVPINLELDPGIISWGGMTLRVAALREAEAPLDDVYYYGVVLPAETLEEYCGDAEFCIKGIGPVNRDGPSGLGTPEGRVAAGVGFPERIFETGIHELGHSHGREHAPCTGGANDPPDPDPDYPGDDGLIDTWGWDLSTGELKEPGVASDLMGYCPDRHVSAYNWKALHTRSAVNRDL